MPSRFTYSKRNNKPRKVYIFVNKKKLFISGPTREPGPQAKEPIFLSEAEAAFRSINTHVNLKLLSHDNYSLVHFFMIVTLWWLNTLISFVSLELNKNTADCSIHTVIYIQIRWDISYWTKLMDFSLSKEDTKFVSHSSTEEKLCTELGLLIVHFNYFLLPTPRGFYNYVTLILYTCVSTPTINLIPWKNLILKIWHA